MLVSKHKHDDKMWKIAKNILHLYSFTIIFHHHSKNTLKLNTTQFSKKLEAQILRNKYFDQNDKYFLKYTICIILP